MGGGEMEMMNLTTLAFLLSDCLPAESFACWWGCVIQRPLPLLFFASLSFSVFTERKESESASHSVVSRSLRPRGLYSPWNSPTQNTGVGSLCLLQGIFPTQGLNHKGSPRILEWVAYPFSSGSSRPRNWTGVSCITGTFFTNWAMREASCFYYRLEFRTLGPFWIAEGNGNPLQCSCLENPRDGGAWWAAVYGVAQSWTRLKRLSSSSSMGLKEKRVSEDEMTGWHHRCNGHELGQTCEGQAWHAAVQNGAEKSWTRLGDWTTMRLKCSKPLISSKHSSWFWNSSLGHLCFGFSVKPKHVLVLYKTVKKKPIREHSEDISAAHLFCD